MMSVNAATRGWSKEEFQILFMGGISDGEAEN